jgi:hypothetical protein
MNGTFSFYNNIAMQNPGRMAKFTLKTEDSEGYE